VQLLSEPKYSNFEEFVQKISIFAHTSVNNTFFNEVEQINLVVWMRGEHLAAVFRISTSTFIPNIEKLVRTVSSISSFD
jgi:hypothetical protein